MKSHNICIYILLISLMLGCSKKEEELIVEVYETSANGNKLSKVTNFQSSEDAITIKLIPETTFQTITGFGGSFTESSAYLLNKLSKKNRDTILQD